MNIKNRIEKLEQTGTKGGFCDCRQTSKTEIYHQTLTSDFIEKTTPQLMSKPVQEVCPLCNREIEKQVFILQGVESNIPKPEDAM